MMISCVAFDCRNVDENKKTFFIGKVKPVKNNISKFLSKHH